MRPTDVDEMLVPALVEARQELKVAGFVLQTRVLSCAFAIIVCEDAKEELMLCGQVENTITRA